MKVSDYPTAIQEVIESPISLGRAVGFSKLGPLHEKAWNFIKDEERAAFEFPRGHYKSTIMSVCAPLWWVTRDPAERVMVMTSTLDLSKKFIASVAQIIKGGIEIRGKRYPFTRIFPHMTITTQGRTYANGFDVAGRTGLNKERNIFPMAVGKAGAGIHPTKGVADDLENEQNCRTAERRHAVIDSYTSLTPILENVKCPLLVSGTPWSFGGLMRYLKDSLGVHFFKTHVWDGVNPDTEEKDGLGPGPDGAWPLDPNIMDAEAIKALQDPNSPKFIPFNWFSAFYLCEPVAGDYAVFSQDIINGALLPEVNQRLICNADGSLRDVGYEIALVDTAKKAQRFSDRNGIVVYRVYAAHEIGLDACRDPEINIFVPVCVREIEGGTEAAIAEVERLCNERSRLVAVGVEDAALDETVLPWMEKPLPNDVELSGIKVGSTQSKDRRAFGLQTAFAQGRVKLLPDFEGRNILLPYLLHYPLIDYKDVFDAAALLSMLPTKGRPIPIKREEPKPGTLAAQMEYEQAVARTQPSALFRNPGSGWGLD